MKRKIPLDSPVRRQLWPINDHKERIAMENSANLIKESFFRDNIIKLNKWNLQNLVDDKCKWYKMNDVGAWIPIKINAVEDIKENEEIKEYEDDVKTEDDDFKTPRKRGRLEKEQIERDSIREKTVKAVVESVTVSTEKV